MNIHELRKIAVDAESVWGQRPKSISETDFVLQFSPSQVLSLLARIEELEKQVEALETIAAQAKAVATAVMEELAQIGGEK